MVGAMAERLSRVGAAGLGLAMVLGCLLWANGARAGEGDASPDEIERVTLDLGDGVSLKFNRIPAGQFVMGSPAGALGNTLRTT